MKPSSLSGREQETSELWKETNLDFLVLFTNTFVFQCWNQMISRASGSYLKHCKILKTFFFIYTISRIRDTWITFKKIIIKNKEEISMENEKLIMSYHLSMIPPFSHLFIVIAAAIVSEALKLEFVINSSCFVKWIILGLKNLVNINIALLTSVKSSTPFVVDIAEKYSLWSWTQTTQEPQLHSQLL